MSRDENNFKVNVQCARSSTINQPKKFRAFHQAHNIDASVPHMHNGAQSCHRCMKYLPGNHVQTISLSIHLSDTKYVYLVSDRCLDVAQITSDIVLHTRAVCVP